MPDLSQSVDDQSIVRTHAAHQAMRIENDGGGNPLYVGWAAPGAQTSDPVWRIQKITGGAAPTAIQWADGNILYDNIWDNRAALPYL